MGRDHVFAIWRVARPEKVAGRMFWEAARIEDFRTYREPVTHLRVWIGIVCLVDFPLHGSRHREVLLLFREI